MKRLVLAIVALTISVFAFAQVPQGMNYQAVARDKDGIPVINTDLVIEVTLRLGSSTGPIVWQEGHETKSNEFGLFKLNIGNGISTGLGSASSFENILWGAGDHYLEIKVDFGNGLIPMGTSKLLSVPYALYAQSAANSTAQILTVNGHTLSISGGNSVLLPDNVNDADSNATNELQTLALNGRNLSISNGNTVSLPADNDGDTTNEIQSLLLNGRDISISKGNTITLPSDNDGDTTNELQTLSLTGNNLTISNGNMVTLPEAWKKSGNNIYYNSGNVSIGSAYDYKDSAMFNVTDSVKLNLPALSYFYSKGTDNFFVTSRNLVGIIQGTNGTNQAIYGLSNGTAPSGTNEGIFGQATGGIKNYGLHGVSIAGTNNSNNYGLFGEASGTTNMFNIGALGTATGSSNYNRGLDGRVTATGAHNEGVFGQSIGAGSGFNIGMYGFAQNSTVVNYGLLGETKGNSAAGWHIAIFGDASNNTAPTSYGLYARSVATTNKYAAYLDGNVTYTGTLTGPSDAKLKTDVQPFGNALDLVKQLKPVTYHFKSSYSEMGLNFPDNQQYGFIAQDVEKILPNLVTTQVTPIFKNTSDGIYSATDIEKFEYKGLNYIGFIPILTKAIQEQQTIIDKQQETINSLSTQLQEVNKKLLEIESKLPKTE